jgi:hypothetical protein
MRNCGFTFFYKKTQRHGLSDESAQSDDNSNDAALLELVSKKEK